MVNLNELLKNEKVVDVSFNRRNKYSDHLTIVGITFKKKYIYKKNGEISSCRFVLLISRQIKFNGEMQHGMKIFNRDIKGKRMVQYYWKEELLK